MVNPDRSSPGGRITGLQPPALAIVLWFAMSLSPVALQAGSAKSEQTSLPDTTLRLANLLEPDVVAVPAGSFLSGSDLKERETAYRLDEAAYRHQRTRRQRWYENERERGPRRTIAFEITRTPITNSQYAMFVTATGHRSPDVDEPTWTGYGLVHPYARTRRHAWRDGRTPAGRENHPVVLVSYADAVAYAQWLSQVTGRTWRLATESQWGESDSRYRWPAVPLGNALRSLALEYPRRRPFRYNTGGDLQCGREPVRGAGRGRPGLRMDPQTGTGQPSLGERRFMGRQRLRRMPTGGPAHAARGH